MKNNNLLKKIGIAICIIVVCYTGYKYFYIEHYKNTCLLCENHNLYRAKAKIAPFFRDRALNNDKKAKTYILYCPKCDFNFFSLRPTDQQLSNLYKDYRGIEYQKLRQIYEPGYTPEFNFNLGHSPSEISFRKQHVGNILNNNVNISKLKNVLDYGGDNGQFIPNELEKCNRCVFEVSDVEPLKGIKKITHYEKLLEQNWDFIMLCHVLEHVSDPKNFLFKEVLKLAKEGTYIYIEVPNQKVKFEVNSASTLLCDTPMHEHLNFFSKKSFERMFSETKFKIVYISDDNDRISVLLEKTK
jgi:SAM-dependent methyltransferase